MRVTMRSVAISVTGLGAVGTITVSTVSGGTATAVKTCTSATSCAASVADGSTIRLAASDPDVGAEDFLDNPPFRVFRRDQLSIWQRRLGRWFEFGTLYTMLAGMLNVLAIYDAFAGPLGAGSSHGSDPRKPAEPPR